MNGAVLWETNKEFFAKIFSNLYLAGIVVVIEPDLFVSELESKY